jgi:hypothetical protein
MISLNIGSLPATISYLVMTGAGLEAANSALGQYHPYHWDVVAEPRVQVNPGLHTTQAAPPYVMRASEEASFAKAFRRSPRVISTGQLR